MSESVRKLFSGLLNCIARKNKPERCRSCPYYHDRDCRDTLMRDAVGYVLMVENGKHMFDDCVDVKDVPFGLFMIYTVNRKSNLSIGKQTDKAGSIVTQ